jgi:hypothetical protein
MKIIKSFFSKTVASNHSHLEFRNKAYAEFGLGNDDELYFRGEIAGISFNDWTKYSQMNFGLSKEELVEIYNNLLT